MMIKFNKERVKSCIAFFLKAGLATPSESNEQRHDVMRQVFSSSQFWVAHIWALQVVLMVTVGDALERIPHLGSQKRHVQEESCFSAVDTGEKLASGRGLCVHSLGRTSTSE